MQAVCKTFQPNEDTFNANVVMGNEESQERKAIKISCHTERKRKYPVTNTKELLCKKDNYIEINNQLDCFGSKEPHNDENIRYSRHSECNEESQEQEAIEVSRHTERKRSIPFLFSNNAILRGLNNCSPQNDGKNSCRLTRGDVGKLKCKVAFTLAEGATHVALSNNSRKMAFTLAEVLITLGIIGVVAALTLPTVINKCQSYVLKQQFKKAYSNLAQVLLQVQSQDFDMSVPNCYYKSASDGGLLGGWEGKDCLKVQEGVLKRLKVIKTCKNDAFENGCIPNYKGFNTMAIEQNPDLSEEEAVDLVLGQPGFYEIVIKQQSAAYNLADGQIIFEYYMPSSFFPCLFAMDINGKKGPNKWGYDVFSFFTISDGKMYKLKPSWYFVEKGGKTTEEMVQAMFK